jgi:2-oxoglutarate ferredoxin oxidoreductase subunit alpha
MTKRDDLIIRVSGEAGDGIISSGDFLTRACSRAGLRVFTFNTFPAEIKGGNVSYQIRLSARRVYTPGDCADILMVLNESSFQRHVSGLRKGGVLIYDSNVFTPEPDENRIDYPIPFSNLAKESAGALICRNIVMLGSLVGLFDLPYENLESLIKERFASKKPGLMEQNMKAFAAGCEYGRQKVEKKDPFTLKREPSPGDFVLMTGSEACGFGAIAAGCDSFFGYPITPGTDIFKFISKELPRKNGGRVMQMEDEIASIGGCIGSSFGGKKTMTSTSGPGLSLMSELLGYASMAEIPLVLVDVQRGGPSTGLPTKTEQSDLNMAIYGTHGETPRIVLAPIDVEDCFYQMINAFNLSEKYQLPVLVLTDTYLGTHKESFPRPDFSKIKLVNRKKFNSGSDEPYLRYRITGDGVSDCSSPGDPGGVYIATGLEHDESGKPSYEPQVHRDMQEKRFLKLQSALPDLPACEFAGSMDSETAILTWGSSSGACFEALQEIEAHGHKCRVIAVKSLYPLPVQELQSLLAGVKQLIVPEVNHTGQLANQIKINMAGLFKIHSLSESGAVPLNPALIIEYFLSVSNLK